MIFIIWIIIIYYFIIIYFILLLVLSYRILSLPYSRYFFTFLFLETLFRHLYILSPNSDPAQPYRAQQITFGYAEEKQKKIFIHHFLSFFFEFRFFFSGKNFDFYFLYSLFFCYCPFFFLEMILIIFRSFYYFSFDFPGNFLPSLFHLPIFSSLRYCFSQFIFAFIFFQRMAGGHGTRLCGRATSIGLLSRHKGKQTVSWKIFTTMSKFFWSRKEKLASMKKKSETFFLEFRRSLEKSECFFSLFFFWFFFSFLFFQDSALESHLYVSSFAETHLSLGAKNSAHRLTE